jgi:hypothetical protein
MEVWMESLGTLHGVTRTEDDLCVAAIGPVKVFVPDELARKLEPHVGEKIGILRTDHDYRLRIFGLERDDEFKSNPLGLRDQTTSKKSLIVIA